MDLETNNLLNAGNLFDEGFFNFDENLFDEPL